jgi:hypothetical protein
VLVPVGDQTGSVREGYWSVHIPLSAAAAAMYGSVSRGRMKFCQISAVAVFWSCCLEAH